MDMQIVDRTWEELQCEVRPLNRMVMVRTLPLEQKVGSLWLPPKLTTFHGELPHQKQVKAVVLSAGPNTTVTSGEVIAFTRLYFAWWKKLEDGCMVGWIDEQQITGYIDRDARLN